MIATMRRRLGAVETSPVRYAAVTVDHFGRILIPKAIREVAGFREGTEVDVVADTRSVRLVRHEENVLLEEREGVLVVKGVAAGDLETAVERDREERLRGLGGR